MCSPPSAPCLLLAVLHTPPSEEGLAALACHAFDSGPAAQGITSSSTIHSHFSRQASNALAPRVSPLALKKKYLPAEKALMPTLSQIWKSTVLQQQGSDPQQHKCAVPKGLKI